MIVVSDTSPLTALLTVGAADLLPPCIIGLLGVVLLAKRNRLISSARAFLHKLDQDAGMYLTEDLREQALKSVGE